jgi:hypothetical protein
VYLPGGRLGLDFTCSIAGDEPMAAVIAINDVIHSAIGPCGPFSGSSGWEPLGSAELARYGLRVDDPIPIKLTVVDFDRLSHLATDSATVEPTTAAGTIRLAVYDYLGPDGYPYPDPPAALPALRPPESSDIDTILDQACSDPANPLAQRALQVTVQERWTIIDLRSQTPGRLHVTVDGHAVATFDWWDYRQALESLDLNGRPLADGRTIQPDDTVTVTITPEGITGDWLARARRQA